MSFEPVAGRECGECWYCCQYLTVDSPDMQKLPSVLCSNYAKGEGCRIYPDRPTPCREYLCGWRKMAYLDDGWRPDRSGVVISLKGDDVPEGFQAPALVLLMIEPERALARPALFNLIKHAVRGKIPVYLSQRGPVGHEPVNVFVNKALAACVSANDDAKFLEIITQIKQIIAEHRFVPVTLQHTALPT
jgi:hypothetical protein